MKKLILSLPIFFSLLGAWSSVSAADIHFTCNVTMLNTSNVMGKLEEKGKLDIYIRGNLINISGVSPGFIQPKAVYLQPATDQWGLEHKISYNYSMPAVFYDELWDVGNTVVDHREQNPVKWWESATSFSLDQKYGRLRFREHIFSGSLHAIQNLEGTCKDVNKESPNSMRNFLDFFRF